MKYLILIPFFLFSQTPNYPDTLYLKSGHIYPCAIYQIEESHIIFEYGTGKGRIITLFLTAVDKIVLMPFGTVYTTKSSFNKELHQLQNIIKERNRKNIFQNSYMVQGRDLYLILSNGDIVSKFSLHNIIADSIVVHQDGRTKLIPLESIVAIKKTAKSEFWGNAGIGFCVGAVGGLLISTSMSSGSFKIGPSPGEGALLGGLGGFLIGGVFGASSGEDATYDLTYMNSKRKLKKINEVLSKQN